MLEIIRGTLHCSIVGSDFAVKKVYYYPQKDRYLIKGKLKSATSSIKDYSSVSVDVPENLETYPLKKNGKFKFWISEGDTAKIWKLYKLLYINDIEHPGDKQHDEYRSIRQKIYNFKLPYPKWKLKVVDLNDSSTLNHNVKTVHKLYCDDYNRYYLKLLLKRPVDSVSSYYDYSVYSFKGGKESSLYSNTSKFETKKGVQILDIMMLFHYRNDTLIIRGKGLDKMIYIK